MSKEKIYVLDESTPDYFRFKIQQNKECIKHYEKEIMRLKQGIEYYEPQIRSKE